jgi:hypothetical protein
MPMHVTAPRMYTEPHTIRLRLAAERYSCSDLWKSVVPLG